jgi:hypothetical protein
MMSQQKLREARKRAQSEQSQNDRGGAGMIEIALPKSLYEFYTARSRVTRISVSDLIVSDLESYHEHRRYQENYAEKVHP